MSEAGAMGGLGEGEGDGDIREFRPEPFDQPPILKAFFKQLPLKDLATCRLVSKLWFTESLSTWRSKATIKFEKNGIVFRRNGSRRAIPLEKFLDRWDAGEWASSPFKKFTLGNCDFKAGDVVQERFMELVGGHVTSLTLEKCSFVGRENFRRIIYQAFPKLQFLKMDECKVDDVILWHAPRREEILAYKEPVFGFHELKSLNIANCGPHSMMDMLSHFHKLKSLRMESGSVSTYRNLLETIRVIRAQDPTKLPLTYFDVDCTLELGKRTASSIELLEFHDQLKLPLQRLEIWFDEDEDSYEDDVGDILSSFPFGFNLDNLEKLVIRDPRFSKNFNYLQYTPNLRFLAIENVDVSILESHNLFSNSSQLEIEDWTLSSLTELRLSLALSPCDLEKLMKWMPNVERLFCGKLDNVQLALVCKNWKNLKELEDWGYGLTDEGVIGIGNVLDAGDGQTGPNITKLKHLASFETQSSRLTAVSIHEGFLKLDNLKKLRLGRSRIGNEAKAAIRRRNIILL